eukprot:scaffold3690_cov113-Isochrysis_galbana.AAC.4
MGQRRGCAAAAAAVASTLAPAEEGHKTRRRHNNYNYTTTLPNTRVSSLLPSRFLPEKVMTHNPPRRIANRNRKTEGFGGLKRPDVPPNPSLTHLTTHPEPPPPPAARAA